MTAGSSRIRGGAPIKHNAPTFYFIRSRLCLCVTSQMKQYLKVDEKWKDWENMEMKWIHHHNPDLVVLDDNGKEKERIDLQGISAAKMEALLEAKGFKRR